MSVEDNLYSLLSLYKNLPFPLKYFIGKIYRYIPKKIKYGGFYFTYLKRIKCKEHEFLLKNQLSFVLEKIPYYHGNNFKSIEEFPIIDKNIITTNFDLFVNSTNDNKIKANTGGSSGTPFVFYLEKGVSRPKEKAHFNWHWGQFGFKQGDKVLMIRGEALSNNKLFEYQAIDNKLAISCYLINESNISEVVNVVNKFNPEFIHAYPSSLKNFINEVSVNKIDLQLTIKAIFLGSEGLLEIDKKSIESYFNSKVVHWYGHSERLIHAGNCPNSDDLHIYPQYGYTELLDNDNIVIEKPNIKGRVVATGYDNSVMPLIRYDTGDEAEYSEHINCKCGFKGKSFKKIHGRNHDYIYLINKTKVSLTAFIFGQHFEEFAIIKEIQLEQNNHGKLIVRLVAQEEKINKKEFIKKLKNSVDDLLEIDLKIVESISKTKRGKHIFLIQNIREI